MERAELQSLVHRGILCSGIESSGSGGRRVARKTKKAALVDRSCFILSIDGLRMLGNAMKSVPTKALPAWDRELRQLSYQGFVVKVFRQPATNQECVLNEFQRKRWTTHINDPLPRDGEVLAKVRLHDTVKALNEYQQSQLLHFGGDGTGRGIIWRPINV